MSLPRYGEYKESGVTWLGAIPSHWQVQRLKYACKVFPSNVDKHSRGEEPAVRLCNYTDVYYNERITSDMPLMQATASDDQIVKFTLRAGDTIITKDSETADDIAIAAYVPEDLPGVICGYHLSMVRPLAGNSGAFVKRLFDSVYAKAKFAVSANGLTRVGLAQYALDNVELPFPPLGEQAAIAAFLDRETAKIDALIAEQEKLIALLAEKRQATISHGVTRGLNPNAPKKDSGIAWLGEVPAPWKIAKLGLFATVENGTTPSRTVMEYWNGDIPWLASGEVNQLRITEASEFITAAALESCSLRLLPIGTVVIGMIGQGKTRGMSAILCISATINQNLAAICPGPRIEGAYILYVLHAMYEWLREARRGGNQAAMNCEMLSALRIPVPPLAEQRSIVDFIETEAIKIDSLKVEAEHAIALFKERRSALITAAVTGQIDVRHTNSQTRQAPESIPA